MFDELHEECGICGVFGHEEAANLTYLGLYALQHRGQEGAGIVSSDGEKLYSHKQLGLVAEVFKEEDFSRLPGRSAIGHVRYSTQGENLLKNVQPFMVEYRRGGIAIAHNGNLVNASQLRDELEELGALFQTSMDSEVIIHLLASPKFTSIQDRIASALSRIKGSYSLLFLTEKEMVAARDPYGFRPLILGRLGNAHVVASETCALDLIQAEYLREIAPGEILVINKEGMKSYFPLPPAPLRKCIFEFVYFARPDSLLFGLNVHQVRKELGRTLAREQPADADIVIAVPDSGVAAAMGYAEQLGVPYEQGLIRNHYIGRTFIEPAQSIRHFGVKIKLNPVREALRGKRVVVVDDSIVRGNTSRKIIKMIREAGAKEVHMRISSPPTAYPCFYGIDTPTRAELIASSHTVEEINKYITTDSLGYLSLEGMIKACGGKDFCTACFSGDYPVEFPKDLIERQIDLFQDAKFSP
jgi:amidophosphoribosyltransferase